MNLYEQKQLRDRTGVFADRRHAGQVLAEMLGLYRDSDAIVLGIPAGGIPVAAALAAALKLPLEVAVVSKMTLPWNTEIGYGAIAFDGTIKFNEMLLAEFRLDRGQIDAGTRRAREKVMRRVELLRGFGPLPDMSGRPVLVVDDGLASGFTMQVALEALSKLEADQLIIAVPTGHLDTVQRLLPSVAALYCANIRKGMRFAVAEAYERWSDVSDSEVLALLKPQVES